MLFNKVDLADGISNKMPLFMGTKDTKISTTHFGEGSTCFNNKIYMMTWKNRVVYVFNMNLEIEKQINMPS